MPIDQSSGRPPWSRKVRHQLLCGFVFVAPCLWSTEAYSQRNPSIRPPHSRESMRGFIDDYTKSLDSDADFDLPRESGSIQAVTPSFDIKQLRPLVRKFSDTMTQLSYGLNEEMGRIPGLRQSNTEALRLSATAVIVSKHAEKHGADPLLQEEIQQVDADWRELAFRLERIPGLSGESKDLMKVLNETSQRIRQVIGIQPQLNRQRLLLKAASLVADLEGLQEDLATELGNGEDAQTYRRSVSRLRQIALNLVTVIRDDRSESKVIVEAYKQFETLWGPVASKLQEEENRYIDHGIRRVAAATSEIHQLLLLPHKMDQSQFIQLSSYLRKDIDEFFERTPLLLVMQLPKAKQALSVAEQFYNVCNEFSSAVDQGQGEKEITALFRRIEQAERSFIDVFQEVDSDKAVAVLNRIHRTVNTLRTSLHLQPDDFDYRAAEELAASIQHFSEQVDQVTRRWLNQDRQPYTQTCLEETQKLTRQAARIHDHLLSGRSASSLEGEVTELYETWRRVYAYIVKCQTEDRRTMGRISSNLTPAMVQLRTMILQ
ncbi:hypothetical protein [Schlesneria sp. DSM 10557]|uniref:hypothetical protein n=2 Tax=unclassified Schlesneria TaxID=2762017 RepID=UPI0035A0014B